VADRGIAKAVPKPVPATVYFDPDSHSRNAWCQFRFAPPLPHNFFFEFHACFRNRNTFGRWQKIDGKSVFIAGTPLWTGKAFVQPVMDLCSWKDYLKFQRDVKVVP